MDDATAAYLRTRYWEEDELLREVREDLERRGPAIQVSADTGRLLATLIEATGAIRVLEVRTLFGYSGRGWRGRFRPMGTWTRWSSPTCMRMPPRSGSPVRASPTV